MPTTQGAITRGAALHMQLVQTLCGKWPLPLPYWHLIHRIVSTARPQDPLFPDDPPVARGATLKSPVLAALLHDDSLGAWSLDVATIDLIWDELMRLRPRTVVECGAGASTLVFAKYAQAYGGRQKVTIVSIEQNASFKDEVEHRLKANELDGYVQLMHAPLNERHAYAIDPYELAICMGSAKADLVLIDGPSGPPGCRMWTLPVLAQSCRVGTSWLLDDALRDGELRLLEQWSRRGGVRVEGIYPTAKGLARGTVSNIQALCLNSELSVTSAVR